MLRAVFVASPTSGILGAMSIRAEDALDLPIPERIRLVAEIWDTITESPDQPPLSAETLAMLRERLAAHRNNPKEGASWSEVKSRISKSI